MTERPCSRCGWQPIYANGLCKADYEYQRRTGQPRPPDKVVAHVQRRNDRRHR
jgi:hypothetical protein